LNSINLDQFSPIQKLNFKGFEFFIKRDDLLGPINGNKARKISFYRKQNYPKGQKFITYGGSQSNVLGALSIFCKENSYKLIFVCERISSFLKQNPQGNYGLALQNKALIVQSPCGIKARDYALSLLKKGDIFIEQGLADKKAELGYIELAEEIKIQSKNLGEEFDIFLASGTGTSAAFLAKHSNFRVFTCPCVGDEAYLKEQILTLDSSYDFSNLYILNPSKKYHFAKPYLEFFHLYKELKTYCGIEFDLLYDILAFKVLLEYKQNLNKILYIHQGGILGNETMLNRINLKFYNQKIPK